MTVQRQIQPVQIKDKFVQEAINSFVYMIGGHGLAIYRQICPWKDNEPEKHFNSMLQKLLKNVEEKINRGASDKWTNYDFEQLSDAILEVTSVQLSVTTLKRIWGKVKYPHAPAIQTLNALAQFIGYTDWRDFEQKSIEAKSTVVENLAPVSKPATVNRAKRFPRYLVLVLALFLLGLIYAGFKRLNHYKIDPDDYSFSLSKIKTTGVPNSVIFTYDASKSPSDSVFIIQTWDIRRKTLVPKNGQKHSAIYYYPGFFNTKLIIDSTIVKRQDLQVSSDGWLGLVQADGNPIYFTKQEITVKEGVSINDSLLLHHEISLRPSSPKTRFFNQRDLGSLMNDNFDFETVVRNPNVSGDNTCHYAEVLIQSKNDIIIIPLGAKACVGNMQLSFDGNYRSSQYDDLSWFGCDLTEWTMLKIVCRERHARIFVNNNLAFELDAPNDPKGIVGVQYRFNGGAEIKYARFWDKSGKLIELD